MERKPDFERFRRAVTTREPGPVTVGDIYADAETIGNYLGETVTRGSSEYLGHSVRFYTETGWDFSTSFTNLGFGDIAWGMTENTSTEVKDGHRVWLDDGKGPIMSWDDFERYKWSEDPHTGNAANRMMAGLVPDGMKVMVLPGGLFEWTTWLMGLVPFSYALTDQPDLVDAVVEKVADLIYAGIEDLMDEPNIGGLFLGDDMGYNTATMVSPKILREKFLPHLKRVTDLVHSAGKVMVLHSCGNLEAIMEDICQTGVDAKHSFEDKIMPVEENYRRWGDRLGIIGGVDMHLLAAGTEESVRKRTREILEACAPTGHYVLGTGNSVANYIPIKNYLAMLDEGRKFNRETFGREY
ncbi:MAG: uroporphyrinogen-III decarboxylase-like protein [Proteobacteria bacterium]|nr:uroporphyrinogen-III decarboxylase-like protein [Pseudomonadota bacterium]